MSIISKIILRNWLVNPTGLPNRFVELDLIQEHLNFWIKVSCSFTSLAHALTGNLGCV